jgi:hypothetical protein
MEAPGDGQVTTSFVRSVVRPPERYRMARGILEEFGDRPAGMTDIVKF